MVDKFGTIRRKICQSVHKRQGTNAKVSDSSQDIFLPAIEYCSEKPTKAKNKAFHFRFLNWAIYSPKDFPVMDEFQLQACPSTRSEQENQSGCQEAMFHHALLCHAHQCLYLRKAFCECMACNKAEREEHHSTSGCSESHFCTKGLTSLAGSVMGESRLGYPPISRSTSNFSREVSTFEHVELQSPVPGTELDSITIAELDCAEKQPVWNSFLIDTNPPTRPDFEWNNDLDHQIQIAGRINSPVELGSPSHSMQNNFDTSARSPAQHPLGSDYEFVHRGGPYDQAELAPVELYASTDTTMTGVIQQGINPRRGQTWLTLSVCDEETISGLQAGNLSFRYPSSDGADQFQQTLPEEGRKPGHVDSTAFTDFGAFLNLSEDEPESPVTTSISPVESYSSAGSLMSDTTFSTTSAPSPITPSSTHFASDYSSADAYDSYSSSFSHGFSKEAESADFPDDIKSWQLPHLTKPVKGGQDFGHKIINVAQNTVGWMHQMSSHTQLAKDCYNATPLKAKLLAPIATGGPIVEPQCTCGQSTTGKPSNKPLKRHRSGCPRFASNIILERPYKCPYNGCSKRFTRSDNLLVHRRNKKHFEVFELAGLSTLASVPEMG